MGSRSYSRSRSPSPRRSRDGDRRTSPPQRYERSSRPDYRNGGDRNGGGDRYRDRNDGRPRYDDRPRRPRNHDARENPRPSNCLGIFGMSMNTSEKDLREIFERYGRVESVKVIMDHGTGRSRGFGFVNFEDRTEATRAREKVSDTVIDGMKVRVDYAIQNRRQSPGGRNRSPAGRRHSPPPTRARYSRSPSR